MMMALARLRRAVSPRLELQGVRKHCSRLGRDAAPRYSEYLESCRAEFRGARTIASEVADRAREIRPQGIHVALDPREPDARHIFGAQKSDPKNPGFDRIDW